MSGFDYGLNDKQQDIEYDSEIKMIVVGDCYVGKTNIILRYTHDIFYNKTTSTTNSSYICKYLNVNNKIYKVNIWDTAGQEKYHSLTKIFLKDCNIALLVYAINDKESFDNLDYWYNTVKECNNNNNVLFMLAGNKSDLFEEEKVSEESGKNYSKKINAIFKITSAKNMEDNSIQLLIDKGINTYIKEYGICSSSINDSIKIEDKEEIIDNIDKKNSAKSCC